MPGDHRDWELYASHRHRLTEALISTTAHAGGRLCVLGAGSCNDLDMERLVPWFAEIHLVDVDATAVRAAIRRQPDARRPKLRAHAPVDLSGLSKRLNKWRQAAPSAASLEATASSAVTALVGSLPGPFDVVVSACMLTQMSFHVRDVLGDGHPMLAALRACLVDIHLSTLVGLTAPGGVGLLVTDFASSTYASLGAIGSEQSLRDVMQRIVVSGKFYHAANPTLIERAFARHALADRPELLEPWLWTGANDRTYLVCAYRVRRA
jgi:hypothetical protein